MLQARNEHGSDVDAFRDDTPGTEHRIHLNNAGAALMPRPVLAAITEHLELEARIGGYEAADARRDAIEACYRNVATLLDTEPSQIAMVENATTAFTQALSAVPFQPGDRLVTTRHDYVSNQIQYISLAERRGVEVLRAPDAEEGGVDVRALEALVHRTRPRLVAVSHVPTNSGLVQDVASIGRICRARDVPLLVDACQSVGQLPVRAEELGCDFLAVTARKFLRGPRGIGFLWVSQRALDAGFEPLFPDLRGADWIDDDLYQPVPDARRFENWEFPYALVLGLGAAARYATSVGIERIAERVGALADRLREGLSREPGLRVLDRGPELCAIVTVAVDGVEPSDAVARLRERRINTSALTLSSGLLDFRDKGVEGALRLSPHYYNTVEEIDEAVEAVASLALEEGGR